MESTLILASIFVGFALTLYLLHRWTSKPSPADTTLSSWLQSLQASIEATNHTLNESLRGNSDHMSRTLQENTRQLNQRLDYAAKVIGDVQKNLGEMSEVGRGIKSLQEFLQSPKLRGGLGEQVLNDMIGESFPKHAFHLQYTFRSGVKVDAVLKTDAGLLCIDSKFPMGNFTRMLNGDTEAARLQAKRDFVLDVKKHIEAISKKYILPEEDTCDFALMFVPSESVYYEVVNSSEIHEFARTMRVYPVSPTTFYAHLQVLLLSFQGKELEAKSREVFKLLRAIQKDYAKVEENIGVLGRHVTNAFNQMNQVNSGFTLLGQKLSQTQHIDLPSSDTTQPIEPLK